MSEHPPLLCVRCGEPVTINRNEYAVFERMHWLCFHLKFEHRGDPDGPCDDPSCPWWHIAVFRAKLQELGYDAQHVLHDAIDVRWQL